MLFSVYTMYTLFTEPSVFLLFSGAKGACKAALLPAEAPRTQSRGRRPRSSARRRRWRTGTSEEVEALEEAPRRGGLLGERAAAELSVLGTCAEDLPPP